VTAQIPPAFWRPLTGVWMNLSVHTLCQSVAVKLHEERKPVNGRKDDKSTAAKGGERKPIDERQQNS
jgi:hypothetical protein